ncbi:wat1-related protein, partial [Quercus suber]
KRTYIYVSLDKRRSNQELERGTANHQHLIAGSLMLVASCFVIAFSIVLQVGTAESNILALVMERGKPAAWSLSWDAKLWVALYYVETFHGGDSDMCWVGRTHVFSKVAIDQQMSNYVLVTYSFAVATGYCFHCPLCHFFWTSLSLSLSTHILIYLFISRKIKYAEINRKFLDRNRRPKMTVSIFTKIMLIGLLEFSCIYLIIFSPGRSVLNENLYLSGIKYTSASFGSAIDNTLPAITFLLACILRSHANDTSKRTYIYVSLDKRRSNQELERGTANHQHLIAGSLMLVASCFVIAFSIVCSSSNYSKVGTAESNILALVMERGKPAAWSLMAMKEKVSLFVTAFSPLTWVIVTAIGSIIFSEQMNLGRVLGAIIVIILGLYLVMWGKAKDQNSFISANGKDKTSLCPSLPVIDQNLFLLGMKYTTATFASALINVLPAIAFVMAWFLRLEKVNLKSIRSQAKVVGTLATVAGAMVITMVKGPVLELIWTKGKTNHDQQNNGTIFIIRLRVPQSH